MLNKKDIREKPKYLVKQKIREEKIRRIQMRKEKKKKKKLNPDVEMFKRSELPGKYIAKILFRQNDGKFEDKYLNKQKKSWTRQKEKGKQVSLEVES